MSDQSQPTSPQGDALERALAVQKKYEPVLLAIPSVIGVGIGSIHIDADDSDEIGVIVMIDPSTRPLEVDAEPDAIAKIPKRLDGVAIQIQEMGPFTAFDG